MASTPDGRNRQGARRAPGSQRSKREREPRVGRGAGPELAGGARRPALAYRAALAVAALSGGAALAHQLLWTRRMADLLGATPAATTRVLGAFFLGLALGAAAAAPLVRHLGRPWRAVALAEAGVAALGMPLLVVPHWSSWLWRGLGSAGSDAGIAWALPNFLVVPPALLMGTTLPFLARATLSAGAGTLGREGNWLYAVNTMGGVLGLTATVALTLAGVGTSAAMTTALALNLLLAAFALRLDHRAGSSAPHAVPAAPATRLPLGPLAVAFLSGLCVLAGETLAVHLFNQVVSLALLGTAAVLIATLLSLALAAGGGAWLAARAGSVPRGLDVALALAVGAALATPFLFEWQTDGGRYLTLEFTPSVPLFVMRALGLGLVAFGPFMLAAGLILPLACRWFADAGADPAGRRWGVLLAINGLGGFLGVELADRFLMPAFGMHLGFAAIAGLYGLAAVATSWSASGWRPALRPAALALALAVAIGALMPRLAALPQVRVDAWPAAKTEGSRLVDLATGPEGTVAVADFGEDRVILMNNQYVLGGMQALIRQRRMGLLPAVLHPNPRRVAFIGLGTGITAGAVLVDPAVESVAAFEISPLVVAMSRQYFAAASGDFASSPRTRTVVEDGRIALAATSAAYDLIVGDLFMPWQVGTGRLYSVEHFRAVHDALAEGGEFCQWLPAYQLTAEQFRVIVASFREAFPTAYLFRDDLSHETPAFALVGFRSTALDWDAVDRRVAVMRQSGRTRDGFVAFPNLLRSLYVGVASTPRPDDGPRNTLDNAWIERRAGLEQVGRTWRYLDADTWAAEPEFLADFNRSP